MSTVVRCQWLTEDHRGWARVWSVIAARYGSIACEHQGEVWEYMGTWTGARRMGGDAPGTTHQFRHRNLRGLGRVYVDLPTDPSDFEETTA